MRKTAYESLLTDSRGIAVRQFYNLFTAMFDCLIECIRGDGVDFKKERADFINGSILSFRVMTNLFFDIIFKPDVKQELRPLYLKYLSKDILSGVDSSVGVEDEFTESAFLRFYLLYNFTEKKRVYLIKDALLQRLLKIDLEKIPAGMLKPPLKCFCLSIPFGKYNIKLDDATVEMEDVYINMVENGSELLIDMLFFGQSSIDELISWPARFSLDRTKKSVSDAIFNGINDMGFSRVHPVLGSEIVKNIFQIIVYIISEPHVVVRKPVLPKPSKTKSPKKLAKQARRATKDNSTELEYHELGTEIKAVTPADKPTMTLSIENGVLKRMSPIEHIVAGFWKYTACGKGWNQHRLTFIEDFVRGLPPEEHAKLRINKEMQPTT